MAQYHVKLGDDGFIHAGTMTKTGRWTNSSEATDEALAAVRDHLLYLSRRRNENISYAWQLSNGKTLILKLEEKPTEEIKEGE